MSSTPESLLSTLHYVIGNTPVVLGADAGWPISIHPAIIHSMPDFTDIQVHVGLRQEALMEVHTRNPHGPLRQAVGADTDDYRWGASSFDVHTSNGRFIYAEPTHLPEIGRNDAGRLAILQAIQNTEDPFTDVRYREIVGGEKKDFVVSSVDLITRASHLVINAGERDIGTRKTLRAYKFMIEGMQAGSWLNIKEVLDIVE
jgi:hypothetical protein